MALALTLPRGTERDTIVAMTYIVVVFSIVIQGLTVKRIASSPGIVHSVRGLVSGKDR